MTMDERDRYSQSAMVEADTPLVSMNDFDEADYLPHLAGLDLTDEQASELLRIIWDIMRMAVEMEMPPESWGQIVSSVFADAAGDSGEIK